MELSKQIKEHRARLEISQEQLAEKMYVSRQTISNWETERSYPDVHNLLLLSAIFDVTLDQLVKGDVKIMKEKISQAKISKDTKIMELFFILATISLGIVVGFASKSKQISWQIFVIPVIFWIISLYYSIKLDKWKKDNDIKTFKEITVFMEGGDVDAARKQRNKVKDVLRLLLSGIVYVVIILLIMYISLLVTRGLIDYFK